MSKIISEDNVKINFANAINDLSVFLESKLNTDCERKLASNYYEWLSRKTQIITNEKNYEYPLNAIPTIINEFEYNYLYPEKQAIINTYYNFESEQKRYVIKVKKSIITTEHRKMLVNNCALKRGNVVWVEFGCNIDCEFGGRHPALILKKCNGSIIVVPLSSKEPKNDSTNVKISKVYNFEPMERWANILRIIPVSVQRIDFNSKIGNVNNSILKEISVKISQCGIK